MQVDFLPMSMDHCKGAMDIYNYYVENSLAAYPDKAMPYEFFGKFIEITKGYPAYTIFSEDEIIGFCFLRAHNPLPTFKECAEITYFIKHDFTGKGVGKLALDKLESEAREIGIKTILASISSENIQSLSFHENNGFRQCGRFEKIITKHGKQFDIIWMQKNTKNPEEHFD